MSDTAMWPSTDWWRGFGSPELDDLIEQARTNNFDIAAAIARIRQADAQVRIAGAALLPTVSGTGTAQWQQISTSVSRSSGTGSFVSKKTSDVRTYSLGADAAYEVDFWQKNLAVRQAAVASAVFSRFDEQTVILTVVTTVASTWFTALAYNDRLTVAQSNLAAAEQTLQVIQARLAAGTASALDVAQQAALVAGQRANIPNLRNQMEQQLIGLGILIGRPPESVSVQPGTLDRLEAPPVGAGIPSELLGRRPDIAAAEADLVAANANIKAARAAFFPSVQLTGSGGVQNAALNTLLNPGSGVASVAAGLTAPIFDGGTLRGNLEQANGRYDELLADYRKSVVQAFTDVEDALTAYAYATQQEQLQREAVRTAQMAADIARAQLGAGTVDITTVLQAQTTLFSDQDVLVQVRLARFLALLNLYKALGGGWTQPGGTILEQFPGLSPDMVRGGVALPIGGNIE